MRNPAGHAATKGWPGTTACIDAAHRIHARVEDCRTGKDTGIGRFPSHDFTVSQAWLTAAMTAQILLAWQIVILRWQNLAIYTVREPSAAASYPCK